jgi:hypothetical protein
MIRKSQRIYRTLLSRGFSQTDARNIANAGHAAYVRGGKKTQRILARKRRRKAS